MPFDAVELRELHVPELIRLYEDSGPEYSRFFNPFPFDVATFRKVLNQRRRDEYYAVLWNTNLAGMYMLRGFDEGYSTPSYGVWIAESYAGLGLARATLDHAVRRCSTIGCQNIVLKVHPDNYRAKVLYEKFGFQLVGQDGETGHLRYSFSVASEGFVKEDDPAHVTYAVHNLEVWARALIVLRELAARDIPVIVLKSLPQVEDLYGHVGGRATGDVDLIVHAEHARAAMDVITGLGWELNEQPLYDILVQSRDVDRLAASRSWHFTRLTNGRSCMIDLHFDAMDPWLRPTLDRAIWHRAVAHQGDGVAFKVPGPEDRLLFLCWHFFSDSTSEGAAAWRSLDDVELILRRGQEIDWVYLARRARDTGTSIFLKLTCEFVAARATAELPPRWRSAIVPPAPRRYAVLWFLLARHFERMGTRQRLVFFLLAHDRLRTVIPLWRHIFFPSRASLAVNRLGTWPSWQLYTWTLVKMYAHRMRKTVRPG